MQVVAKPLASVDFGNRKAGVAVCERQEEVAVGSNKSKDDSSSGPANQETLTSESLGGSNVLLGAGLLLFTVRGADKLDESTGNQARGKVGGKVVVQEKLATHEEEWEVMRGPGQPEEASRVVETRASTYSC